MSHSTSIHLMNMFYSQHVWYDKSLSEEKAFALFRALSENRGKLAKWNGRYAFSLKSRNRSPIASPKGISKWKTDTDSTAPSVLNFRDGSIEVIHID